MMPVAKDLDKSGVAKASTVYKCIMVKCDIDFELGDKNIHIKIVHKTVDHYVPHCKGLKNKSKNMCIPKYTPIPHQVLNFF